MSAEPGATDAASVISIRPATRSDRDPLGRYGGAIMRQHHAADPMRFLQADDPETGYGGFLAMQIGEPGSLAEHEGKVMGYVYAAVNSTTTWVELRGRAAWCTTSTWTNRRAASARGGR